MVSLQYLNFGAQDPFTLAVMNSATAKDDQAHKSDFEVLPVPNSSMETQPSSNKISCFEQPSVGPCEACTFKEGQIFALVQILHSFHCGQLGRAEQNVASNQRKRVAKGILPTYIWSV